MSTPRCASLYQINTRVWLTELSRALGRPATLNDIPNAELDRLAEMATICNPEVCSRICRPGRPPSSP